MMMMMMIYEEAYMQTVIKNKGGWFYVEMYT